MSALINAHVSARHKLVVYGITILRTFFSTHPSHKQQCWHRDLVLGRFGNIRTLFAIDRSHVVDLFTYSTFPLFFALGAFFAESNQDDYRLFVGDLGNEVTDDNLAGAFRNKYASFAKARIIREKWNKKSKGYGFVSFLDG